MCKDGKRTLNVTHGITDVKGGVQTSLKKVWLQHAGFCLLGCGSQS